MARLKIFKHYWTMRQAEYYWTWPFKKYTIQAIPILLHFATIIRVNVAMSIAISMGWIAAMNIAISMGWILPWTLQYPWGWILPWTLQYPWGECCNELYRWFYVYRAQRPDLEERVGGPHEPFVATAPHLDNLDFCDLSMGTDESIWLLYCHSADVII